MRLRYGLVASALLLAGPVDARTLLVGDGRAFKLPSDALAAAHDGDTVSIAPGEYFDCAIVRANDLIIQGEAEPGGKPAAMTDKVCEEKAILVLRGNNMTIRNLSLQRARVPDGNGAGIRLENQDLTVDHVTFRNDQVGILSGMTGGDVTITDSLFTEGGVGGDRPKYALMIGRSSHLRVQGSTFTGTKGGEISTEADRSDIVDDRIGVGTGDVDELPAYAVLATGGALSMERDTFEVGPLAPLPNAAIGIWDGATATIAHSQMINRTGRPLSFVKDWSWNDPTLQANTIGATDSLTTSSGVWRHRAARQYYLRKIQAHDLASQAKQMLKKLLGR